MHLKVESKASRFQCFHGFYSEGLKNEHNFYKFTFLPRKSKCMCTDKCIAPSIYQHSIINIISTCNIEI